MSSPPQNLIQKIMIEDINTLTFDSFIQTIKTIKVYRSNANKEYKVVKVNKTTLVLRNQRTKPILKYLPPKCSVPCKILASKTVLFLKCANMLEHMPHQPLPLLFSGLSGEEGFMHNSKS